MKRWKKSLLLLTATGMLFSSAWASALAEEKEEGMLNFDLDQVVVTATKTEKALKDVPASVTVITRADLERQNIQNLDEALSKVAGVYIKPAVGNKGTTISMRGLRQNNVLVLMDGMPLNNGYSGGVQWNGIQLSNIEKIEVIRGSFSALYGSNAMGGVINIITRDQAKPQTTIRAGIGNDHTHIGSIASNGSSGKLDYFVDYYKYTTDGYASTTKPAVDGKINRENERYNLKLNYRFTDQDKLSIMVGRYEGGYDFEKDYTGGERVVDTFNLNYAKEFNPDLKMNVHFGILDASKDITTGSTYNAKPIKTQQADINWNWQANDRHLLTVGMSYKEDEGSGETYSMNAKTGVVGKFIERSGGKATTTAFYLQDEITLNDKLTWYVGGRYDDWKLSGVYNSSQGNVPDRSESQFSPKTSVQYKANDQVSLYASVGKSFNSPGLFHLTRFWPAPSGVLDLRCNPDLEPEKLTSYEFGANIQTSDKTSLKLGFFRNDYKNYIDQMDVIDPTTGKKQIINGKEQLMWDNAANAIIKGFEMEINHQFDERLSGFFNYTYNDSRVTEDERKDIIGNQLTTVPRNSFNLGLNYYNKGLNVNLTGSYASRAYESLGGQEKDHGFGSYESHFLVDTKIAYDFNEDTQLAFSVDNIFDKEYYQEGLAPGRTYLLEFTQKF